MASWTDKPLTQFSPYIEQIPVQAYTAVGIRKQQLYDEGLQRIQSQIDSVSGLDIARDVDKQYLKGKLSSLDTQLKAVAAGDFSQFQLQNSVGGMISQISRDPGIQSAVSSTMNYRKQLENMQTDQEKGNLNPANVYDFESKASRWLSSPTPGEKFTGIYQKPVNYMKKWTGALKSLHTNLTSQDILNVMDSKGNVDKDKLAATMTRTKTEGVSASQIENVIRATLTPEDINQLAIEGRYQFKGATPEQLQTHAIQTTGNSIGEIDRQIDYFQKQASLATSDAEEHNRLTSMIDDLRRRKEDIQMELPSTLKDIQDNPDEARYRLYLNGAIHQFAQSFSWEHKELQHLSNPQLEAQQKERSLSMEQQRLNLSKEEFSWKKYMDTEDYKLKLASLEQKHPKQGAWTIQTGILTNVTKDPVAAMQNDTLNLQTSADKIVRDYAQEMKITPQEVEKKIQEYQGNKKNAIDAAWRGEIDDVIKMREDAKVNEIALEKAKEKVMSDPLIKEKYRSTEQRLQEKPSLDLVIEGHSVHYTPQELFQYLTKRQRGTTLIPNLQLFSPYSGSKFEEQISTSGFNNKEQALHQVIQGMQSPQANSLLRQYEEIVNQFSRNNAEISDRVRGEVMSTHGQYIPQMATLEAPNEASQKHLESLATQALNQYSDHMEGTPGGTDDLSQSQIGEAREWLKSSDSGKIKYSLFRQGNSKWLIMQLGKKDKVIRLFPDLAGQIQIPGEPSPDQERLMDRYAKLGGRTNLNDDPTFSFFKAKDFPGVTKYQMAADMRQDRKEPSKNYVTLRIKTPEGWKIIPMDDFPMDIQTARRQIQSLTDEQIEQLARHANIKL